MDTFDLAQRHYLHEVERQSSLSQAVSLPLALVTALLTGIITMLTQVTRFAWWAEIALAVFSGAATISLLVAITNLVRASVGYRYAHPGTVDEQIAWKDKRISEGLSLFKAEEEMKKMLEKEYADCSRVNALHNDTKSKYLEYARVYIVTTVCILAIAAVPYLAIRTEKQTSTDRSHAVANSVSERSK